jgi:DNA polymerase I-like protein with 3'-5' exonuclease and polymerase domains
VGSHVFGVSTADVTPAMRSKVKAMSYGLAYGLSAFGLSRQLRIPVDEAKGLMTDYFERFGGRPRLPDVDRRRGAAHRLHRDDARTSAVPARPDERQQAAA